MNGLSTYKIIYWECVSYQAIRRLMSSFNHKKIDRSFINNETSSQMFLEIIFRFLFDLIYKSKDTLTWQRNVIKGLLRAICALHFFLSLVRVIFPAKSNVDNYWYELICIRVAAISINIHWQILSPLSR